jgi:hypothetical protein
VLVPDAASGNPVSMPTLHAAGGSNSSDGCPASLSLARADHDGAGPSGTIDPAVTLAGTLPHQPG